MTVDDAFVVKAVATTFTTLLTAISVLWAKQVKDNRKLTNRSDQCEKDRVALWARIEELSGLKTLLDRCPNPTCPFKPDEQNPALSSAPRRRK